MPSYQYTQDDARDHFDLGRIEPGAIREFDEAPDWTWVPVHASTEVPPAEAPAAVAEDPFAQVTAALAAASTHEEV